MRQKWLKPFVTDFTFLPKNGLFLHLPHPNPNTFFMPILAAKLQYSDRALERRILTSHFKAICHITTTHLHSEVEDFVSLLSLFLNQATVLRFLRMKMKTVTAWGIGLVQCLYYLRILCLYLPVLQPCQRFFFWRDNLFSSCGKRRKPAKYCFMFSTKAKIRASCGVGGAREHCLSFHGSKE